MQQNERTLLETLVGIFRRSLIKPDTYEICVLLLLLGAYNGQTDSVNTDFFYASVLYETNMHANILQNPSYYL